MRPACTPNCRRNGNVTRTTHLTKTTEMTPLVPTMQSLQRWHLALWAALVTAPPNRSTSRPLLVNRPLRSNPTLHPNLDIRLTLFCQRSGFTAFAVSVARRRLPNRD